MGREWRGQQPQQPGLGEQGLWPGSAPQLPRGHCPLHLRPCREARSRGLPGQPLQEDGWDVLRAKGGHLNLLQEAGPGRTHPGSVESQSSTAGGLRAFLIAQSTCRLSLGMVMSS